MAHWNISRGAAVTSYINGLPSGVDNEHGRIMHGGNLSASSNFSKLSLGVVNNVVTIVSGANGITGTLPNGVFNEGDYVIRRVTTDIAGVSNSVLLTGASNSANKDFSIKQVTKMRTRYYKTAIRTNTWNEFSGVFTQAVGVGTTGVWDQTTDANTAGTVKTSNTDQAANPSAAVPGELVYRNGSPTPVQDDYPASKTF